MRSTPGDTILVYLSSPATVSIRTDKITASRPVQATWIDPRTGGRTEAGTLPDKGAGTFSPPPGWEDALLLLRSAKRQ